MNDKHTILVVDDDPSILLGLKLKIGRHGYQVITAIDGNDGLTKIRTYQPDLVLSDVMMPFPDGFEMRRRLSQDSQLDSIPFIFLTARTDTQDRLRGFREGWAHGISFARPEAKGGMPSASSSGRSSRLEDMPNDVASLMPLRSKADRA